MTTEPLRIRPRYVRIVTTPKASEVAARWKASYYQDEKWIPAGNLNPDVIHANLLTLGDSVNRADIDLVIGNRSWTLHCDGCSEGCDQAISLGEFVDNNRYCATCIREAAHVLLNIPLGEI